MTDHEDTNPDRDKFVKAWHEFGLRFSSFVADHQLAPDTWEPDVLEFDDRQALQ